MANTDKQLRLVADEMELDWLKVLKIYKMTFFLLVFALFLLITVGVNANVKDFAVLNFWFAALFAIVLGFYLIYPTALLWVFGGGAIRGLPTDWSINKLKELFDENGKPFPDLSLSDVATKGIQLILIYLHKGAHVAYLGIVIFVFLGTWHIEKATAVLPILVTLVGIGLWTILLGAKSKWYLRVTSTILLSSLAVLFYQGYFADEKKPQNKPIGGIRANNLLNSSSWNLGSYKKTLVFELQDLKGKEICGVKPGTRTFRPTNRVVVNLRYQDDNGEAKSHGSVISTFLLVNDTVPGEEFEVDNTGCVKVSFSHPKRVRETNTFDPQKFELTFQ